MSRRRICLFALFLMAAFAAALGFANSALADCSTTIVASGCTYVGPNTDTQNSYFELPLTFGDTYTMIMTESPTALPGTQFLPSDTVVFNTAIVPAANQDPVLAAAGFPGFEKTNYTFTFTDPTTTPPFPLADVSCISVECSFTYNGQPLNTTPGGQQAFISTAAKRATGVRSDARLIELALASLLVGEDFGEWLVAQLSAPG